VEPTHAVMQRQRAAAAYLLLAPHTISCRD